MNRRQKKRKLERRRNPRSAPSPAMLAYIEVKEKAKRQKKGKSFILTQMQKLGYLPDGSGGWREMTKHEKEMWKWTS